MHGHIFLSFRTGGETRNWALGLVRRWLCNVPGTFNGGGEGHGRRDLDCRRHRTCKYVKVPMTVHRQEILLTIKLETVYGSYGGKSDSPKDIVFFSTLSICTHGRCFGHESATLRACLKDKKGHNKVLTKYYQSVKNPDLLTPLTVYRFLFNVHSDQLWSCQHSQLTFVHISCSDLDLLSS